MLTADRIGLLACVAAGAALPLAFAPFGQFWIAPLSYAVLLYLWGGAAPRRAFVLGFAHGAASFLAGTYWIYISVHDFGQAPASLAIALTGGLVAVLALFVGAAGWAAARWFQTTGPLAWFGFLPALFVLTEWFRGWLFTGFGWLSAGYSQTDTWLMAYAPTFGLHGMSWAVLLSAGALVALVAGSSRTRARALAALTLLWGGAWALSDVNWTEPTGRVVRVALAQGAVPQDLKWLPEQLRPTLDLYRELTLQSRGSELVIWPEAAIPAIHDQVAPELDRFRREFEELGAAVMFGILRRDAATDTFQNTLMTLADPPAVYVKRHLVPFGEYFPVPGFVRNWMRLMSLPYVDAEPGAALQPPIELIGEKIAVTICYEDVFGAEQLHYLPEATLLVNVSNDAWFGDSIAPHQHLQIARLRAAEAGRYLLRSTNTGISAIIDPRGRVTGRLPQFEPGVLADAVQPFTGATPYARWGNFPVVIGVVLTLLAQFATKLTMRRGT